MHLPITLGTELLLEVVDLKLRTKSVMVGMDGGRYIIINLSPKEFSGVKPEALKQSPIIIRYLYRGSVYGFKAKALNIISSPASLLFITYPDRIEEHNVRHNPRYECILPAKIKAESEVFDIVIVDISTDGCRAIIKTADKGEDIYKALDIDRKIEVKLQLPGTEDKLALIGKVRNINREDDRILFGAMFEDVNPDVKERLLKFISLIADLEKKPAAR